MKRLRLYAKTGLFGWKPCIYAGDLAPSSALYLAIVTVCAGVPALSYTYTA